MHLDTVQLRDFRSFDNVTVRLRSDLTIFVGENNGGKSNVVDSIRLVTKPLSGRRDIYCEPSDIRAGSKQESFRIQATYSGLHAPQQGRLISALTGLDMDRARFGIDYHAGDGRPTLWAGQFESAPEPGAMDMIRHVYLPPLRDARQALASGNPTRIQGLIRYFLGKDEEEAFRTAMGRGSGHAILSRINDAVTQGLTVLTDGVRPQVAAIGFNDDEQLIDIARDLRFKMADQGIAPEDLGRSGHGYANLLYMAAVAVELQKVRTADLTLFLVEEPEAHLHPQLQAAVLAFLEEQAHQSRGRDGDGSKPAGELQVIVASHSPNLSAWVTAKNAVVFRGIHPRGENGSPDSLIGDAGAAGQQVETTRRVSRCVPLSELQLEDNDWRRVDRYLDVTRSSLLFGDRVLLVEGMAEALLFPVIARKLVLPGKTTEYRRFRGTTFVPIDGVDFEPYVKLLLTPHDGVRIAHRVVVVTDGDKKQADGTTPGEERRRRLTQLADSLGAADSLSVFVSTYTLEPELVRSGNADLLRSIYVKLHSKSGEKWDVATGKSGLEQAAAIAALFNDTRKGDFAHLLAEAIEDDRNFSVPTYLREAIEAVVR